MQVDQILKDFWEDNDRFADFFNTVFFGGENVIAPEELETLSPEVSAAEETKQGLEGQTKYRDKVKRWKGVKLAVLGIENQDRIHYAMPERTLLYEALQYEAQRKETASRHRKQKDLRGSENRPFKPGTDSGHLLRGGAVGRPHKPGGDGRPSGGDESLLSGLPDALVPGARK